MTTLPVLWGEAEGIGELVQGRVAGGWTRRALESRYGLEPVDTLTPEALRPLGRLMLAQPRVLRPEENVALDDWVRAGGRLLLFADPMLTAESRFPPGDRRRPQDVALLSPILSHWGLELAFDPDQPPGPRAVPRNPGSGGPPVPVDRAGLLRPADGAPCHLTGGGLIATCRIGRGHATIVADAAVLQDAAGAALPGAEEALMALLAESFP